MSPTYQFLFLVIVSTFVLSFAYPAAKQCKITNDNNGTTEEWYIDVFDTICAEKCVSDIWQLPEYQCDNELVCCSNPVARGSDDDVGEDVVDEVADDVADDDN